MNCDHVGRQRWESAGSGSGAGYHVVGRLISIAALGTGTPGRTLSDGTGGVWVGGWGSRGDEVSRLHGLLSLGPTYMSVAGGRACVALVSDIDICWW